VPSLRLKALAQAIDIRLRRTDFAEKFDLACAQRIGNRFIRWGMFLVMVSSVTRIRIRPGEDSPAVRR